MKTKPLAFIDAIKNLHLWVDTVIRPFPEKLGEHFYQGFYAFIGALDPLSLKHHQPLHLKRLLIHQLFLQKEFAEKEDEPCYLRLFSSGSSLYLSTIFPSDQKLTAEYLVEILCSLVPSLEEREFLSYQWISKIPSSHFLHLAFEKMRGPYFSPYEVNDLEKQLIKILHIKQSHAKTTTFWPYNHEEGYRQLLLLEKEIESKEDLPHVWIQFHNRTDGEVTFIIYLVKPRCDEDKSGDIEAIKRHLPHVFHLKCYFHQEIERKIPVQVAIYSVSIPNKWTPFSHEVNILNARERIGQELTRVIGPFRDFNGGLLETQKKRFSKLTKDLSHEILNFSFFCQPLFYGIYPIEKQLTLSDERLKELFDLFSDHLEKNQSVSKTEHVLILSLKNPDETSLMISKYRRFQKEGKVTAYAHLNICSKEYFCVIGEKAEFLKLDNPTLLPAKPYSKPSILRLAFKGGILPSFSPYHLGQDTRGYTLANFLFEGLVRSNHQGEIVHAGAETIRVSEDQTTYLFKMRPNHWSNGEVVTAFQYEKAWKTCKVHKDTPFFDNLTVRALDADSLQVNLAYPDPFFLEKLTYPILFAVSYKEEPFNFNGPYLIKTIKKTELILERNPFYWDFKNIFFDEVRIQFDLSSEEVLSLFKEGQIDWMGDPLCFNPPKACSLPIKTLPWNRQFFIHFNTEESFLFSPSIRKAFNVVIDRRWISENLFKDSKPMFTFFHSDSDVTFHPFKDADIEQGKKWFSEGLKEINLLKQHFPVLTFLYSEGPGFEELANYLKKVWEQAFGISIHLEKRPWNKFFQKLEQGEFHIAGFFRSLYFPDAFLFFKTFSGKYRNFSQWSHAFYSQIIKEIKQTECIGKRNILMEKLDKILVEEIPAFPLLNAPYRHISSPHLKNYALTPLGGIDFRFAFFKNAPFVNNIHRFLNCSKGDEIKVIKKKVACLSSNCLPDRLKKRRFFFQNMKKRKETKSLLFFKISIL